MGLDIRAIQWSPLVYAHITSYTAVFRCCTVSIPAAFSEVITGAQRWVSVYLQSPKPQPADYCRPALKLIGRYPIIFSAVAEL